MSNVYTRDQKLVRRLKQHELAPAGISVRLVRHPRSRIRWEAENAVTGEKLRVGSVAGFEEMSKCQWIIREEEGWKVLYPGEPMIPDLPGGGYIRNYTGRGRTKNLPGL